MKRIFTLIIFIIGIVVSSNLQSQTFEIRIIENDYGYLEVQMRETSGTGTPTTSTQISTINFQIRWLSSLSTDVDLICVSNNYNIADGWGSMQTQGSYNYRAYYATSTPFSCPTNWTTGDWETITSFKATSGSGSGDFEIAPDLWVPERLNWAQGSPATTYHPSVNGSASGYDYPTVVYTHVWTGGIVSTNSRYKRWERGGNWMDECGNPVADYPFETDNAFIPDVSLGTNNFPEVTTDDGWACLNLNIAAGAHISVPDLTAAADQTYFRVDGNVIINGALYLTPSGYTTVAGSTTINSANGIIVESDATGTGSFIDNGTITYGASGSAKVQTYLTNSAGAGNLDIHLVGPTVDQISGGTNGALLGAFNLVNGNTYAYEWDESQNFDAGWVNIFSTSYTVYTGSGIGLSTDDGSTNTLEMTGELMTGNISSQSLGFTNNHNELLSNPYASSIDFDGLASDNSAVVQNKYWIWDPLTNDYIERVAGVGGSQYIQVGQGFFVETKQSGTFDFTNGRRAHSNTSFRNEIENLLSVQVTGGMEQYKDNAYIRFTEEATSGYDIEIEAAKWQSQNSDATQISTIAGNNTILAINALPLYLLNSGMTSVPMNFSCGYNTDYELAFEDMDTFEYGTEIWLEDKLTGGDWVNVIESPIYTFTASPDDQTDRFIIHFFGPTGIDEGLTENSIDIFSSGQFAYVRNNTGETIKKVNVFTLGGELLIEDRSAALTLNKYRVHDEIGYFVVRVITDENVYTKKVLITK